MQIEKSIRYSKITGDFAENLVLYWLSKHGFECAGTDHTGIDLIAIKKDCNKPYGISVKNRSRGEYFVEAPFFRHHYINNIFDGRE